jgi:hypothetical protein
VTRRPYDWRKEEASQVLQRFLDAPRDLAAAFKEAGVHVGLAIGKGPLECPTCGTPWPCPHEKETEKAARGKAAPTT